MTVRPGNRDPLPAVQVEAFGGHRHCHRERTGPDAIARAEPAGRRPDRRDADAYAILLKSEIFPGIFAKNIPGLERLELLRSDLGDEVEFMTIMWLASWQAVQALAGEDYATAYVPASARALLADFDERAQHHEIRAGQEA